jgi:tRNA(fMet)-specific endonuclease VapC
METLSPGDVVLLDSDVISWLVRGTAPQALLDAIAPFPQECRCTSAVSVGEVLYGLERAAPRHAHYREEVERRFFQRIEVVPFDEAAARVYAALRVQLERAGQRLNDPDLRIAATALARGLVLATGNRSHFGRVPGLRLLDLGLD